MRWAKAFFGIFFLLGFLLSGRADLTTNLEGYWPLDGDLLDFSGNNRDLTKYGGSTYASGILGQGLNLAGSVTQYADRGGDDDASMDPGSSDFAVQIWVKFSNLAGQQVLIEKFTGGAGPGWTLSKTSPTGLQFYGGAGGPTLNAPAFAYVTGTWYHFVVTRTGTSVVLYRNNGVVASATTGAAIPNTTQDLMLGMRDNTNHVQPFPVNGVLDEAAFWSRGLTVQEVSALYNSGAGGNILPLTTEITCPSNITVNCGESLLPENTGLAIASSGCASNTAVSYQDQVVGTDCSNVITRVWSATNACGGSAICTQLITVVDVDVPYGGVGGAGIRKFGTPITYTPGDTFGNDVTLSRDGQWMAVGNQAYSNYTGRVQVYERVGSDWVQRGQDLFGVQGSDRFGFSLALSADGQRLAVGATESGIGRPGYARTYDLVGGTWVPVGTIPVGTTNNDQYGYDVDLSDDGSRLAVGGANSAFQIGIGYIQVFELVANTWSQLGATLLGAQAGDRFGWNLAMSADGSRVAVGAQGFNSNNGRVGVFDWNGAAWVLVGNTLDGNGYFGGAMSISADGSMIGVGSWLVPTGQGEAKVFVLTSNVWTQAGSTIVGGAGISGLGYSIAMSSDGQRLVIGTRNDATRAFSWDGSSYSQDGSDLAAPIAGPNNGQSVAMSGDGNLVAVSARNGSGTYTDLFYTYLLGGGSQPFSCTNVVVECGNSIAPVDIGFPVAVDLCDTNVALSHVDVQTGACPSVVMREWTATDDCGNSAVCTQVITVVDTVAPVLTCPASIMVTNYFGSDGAYVAYVASANDACDPSPSFSCSPTSGAFFLTGTTTVVCVSVDACGNSNSCSNVVTVVEQAFLDTDLDEIDDNWEQATFTNLTTAGIGTDYDMDGQSDADESLIGTDAKDAGDSLAVDTVFGGSGNMLSWPIEPGKSYNVQYRPDLQSGSWSNIALGVSGGSFLDNDANRINLPHGIYRVVVP